MLTAVTVCFDCVTTLTSAAMQSQLAFPTYYKFSRERSSVVIVLSPQADGKTVPEIPGSCSVAVALFENGFGSLEHRCADVELLMFVVADPFIESGGLSTLPEP